MLLRLGTVGTAHIQQVQTTLTDLNDFLGPERWNRYTKTNSEKFDRGSFSAKVHTLFEYFDIDHKQGISYVDLLKMVFS